MGKKPLREDQLDERAYDHATRQFQLMQKVLPEDAVQRLAEEVVRRLTFRMPRNAAAAGMPSADRIERFTAALLSADAVAGDRIIMTARREGAAADVVYLGYVAGAARRLGDLWNDDVITFSQVTVASARLYRIIRGMRRVIDRSATEVEADRHVLFALVPDDSHTLGIEMATDLFRRDGWEVELSVGEDQDQIVARTETVKFQSIVLVAHSDKTLPNLISTVLALRITQPMAYIVVAGNIVGIHDDIATLVGADDVIPDVEHAVSRLRALISE